MDRSVLISRATAGGKARGHTERIEALSRYHTTPRFCRHCGRMLEVGERRVADVRKKKFCDNSCAASWNNRHHPERYKRSKIDVTNSITVS